MPSLVAPVVAPGTLSSRAQPHLCTTTPTGAVLDLRPWVADDAPAVAAVYDDPAVQRWHVRSMTLPEARAWVVARGDLWTTESGAEWAVTAGGELVGRCGLNYLDLDAGVGTVAYWVAPAARRRGIATAALRAVVRWAFDEAGLQRLVLDHSTHNAASCTVAEGAGFACEGTERASVRHADGWHDMHRHALLRTDDPR
ncbi:RimJ/RimL family protein N-acetyltransferase [Sediminihabitans luteus]|uniref:RimJ/RimL family protein N-acetyltransferase n=1 Tax=Sediminihabitans luteus TaxID=1138585 RepID=A0A2M9D180_9CELL|nr:GNAT family protein [Sediminihabitans luteus]PJJ77932.1 RimJ/RimL family protein N-acetyltransferase [Sediminihabitans luteus]GII99710.1 acetyltransferase [Sediminihabitans luteus]